MAETRLSNGSRRKRMKEENHPPRSLDLSSFDRTTFPQILAASFNIQNPHSRSLIKRFLNSLLNNKALLLPQSFLSLLPLLLSPKYPSLASLSLEAIGAAALCSLEMNAMIASDEVSVKGVVWALGSENRRLAKAACNALMDLATSQFGRERLRESFALEKLLSLFCQVANIREGSDSSFSMEKANNHDWLRKFGGDDFPAFILDAIIFLINTSTEDLLDRIPVKQFFPLLKELFEKIQSSRLSTYCRWNHTFLRSTKHDLASVIFRISMNQDLFLNWEPNDVISGIFGAELEFVNFVLNYWEETPLLIRKNIKSLENKGTIFGSLVHSFDPTTTETIIYSILQRLVSCPPITSDELDIFSFLNEVKDVLGSSIIYGQDIRILKTLKPPSGTIMGDVNKETHFFNVNMTPEFIDAGAFQKCKEAFHYGYTIALRGMEFRSKKIAAVADGLAILFGQPSVGANIYLTPSGSQGLAKHYDDHCVFVWQLFGQKKWRISPCPETLLPRLYEPVGDASGHKHDLSGGMQCLLNEGDILYIPRGFIHEACTIIDENVSRNEVSTKLSLHLTLGIEIEAPFEWEGFAHIALHCWNEKKKKQASNITFGSRIRKQNALFCLLLHVAIKLIANENPIFRKACMVAAFPLPSNTLLSNNRSTFDCIIGKVDSGSSFGEAFKCIKTVVQERNGDTLQWMRWLQHLSQEGGENEKIDFNNPLEAFEDVVLLHANRIAEATDEFSCFKSKFCREAVFEDACKCFITLTEKYRKIRRQYMNGMLSLHST